MAPKLPGKFDDISKTASSVLGDDFQCKDFQVKSKQKTNLNGATAEITVDLFPKAGDIKTPAKLNFKFPKPFGFLPGLAIDKFELDSAGNSKTECSLSKDLHGVDGLKLEVKGDLSNQSVAATYTGIPDASVKFETKNFSTTDFTAECLYGAPFGAVIGANFKGANIPSIGLNYQSGPIFASVFAKNAFSEFTTHGHYKVSNDINVAATFQQGGKTSGSWSIGGAAALGEITAKAKLESSMTLSLAFKKDLAKGTTFFGGLNYNLNSNDMGYGAKVSIE